MAIRHIRLLALLSPLTLAAGGEATTADPASSSSEEGTAVAEVESDEVKAFKDTLKRFGARMGEFEKEARAIVDRQESEERSQLESGYGALISDLKEQDLSLRETAMKRFEAYLDKYPRSVHTPHVMFRLAELYFEEAEEDWVRADKEFQAAMSQMDLAAMEDLPEDPKKNYRRSLGLYQRIIEQYPDYEYLDGAYYMLGYCKGEPASAQYDEEAGLDYFKKLVELFPKSGFAAAAHLRIGEYYFDNNDLDDAIVHYEQVVELEGREGSLYDEGLYKLAWSRYKQSDYDQALTLLTELLDWSSDVAMARTGKESPMAPEAIEYTAISFSDLADLNAQASSGTAQGNPLAVAQEFYGRVGNRDFESRVYQRLADVLKQQARYDEAIQAYAYLQDTWPSDADNPTYQWTVAQLHMSKVPADVDGAQASIAELTERYNEDSAWYRDNRANPDALAVARGYIEQSLAAVATTSHSRAIESGDPADFAKAAEYYREYLTKFPFATDYYEIEWYLADTLLKAGRLSEAEREYEQLLKGGNHNYKQGALWLLMQVRRQELMDKYGAFEKVPDGAPVEKRVATKTGREREVFGLSDEHKDFIEVCDLLVDSDFKSAAARVQEQLTAATDDKTKERLEGELANIKAYAEALSEFRVALMYLPAQILYFHGHFDEARPRFERIITEHTLREEAAYSASLMVGACQAEDDLECVRRLTSIYTSYSPPIGGNSQVAAVKAEEFTNLLEGSAFKLALDYVEKGDRAGAATAFDEFVKEFPKSKYRKEAIYNAANSYEIIGRIDEAIKRFEQYVKENPTDERSRPLFFRLARNYATALELDKAVGYYETLYANTKGKGVDYQDAPAALYNAGFLRIGMGDPAGAARNFERYAKDSPDLADAEEVMFQAGAQWEKVGAKEAIASYQRYLSAYPTENPDRVMEAYNRIAVLTEKVGRPRDITAAWDDLRQAYVRLAPTGKIGSRGRHYAAHADFRNLEQTFEGFKVIKFSRNDEKNAELLLETKKTELVALETEAQRILTTYQDFKYSSAALFVIGSAYLTYGDMLFNAPIPEGLDFEEEELYREAIDQYRIPVEEKGRARLEANLAKAKEEKQWSPYLSATLEELVRRYPAEFNTEKQELRGKGDSMSALSAGPMSLRAGEDEEEAPAPAPAPAPAVPEDPGPASPWGQAPDGGDQ